MSIVPFIFTLTGDFKRRSDPRWTTNRQSGKFATFFNIAYGTNTLNPVPLIGAAYELKVEQEHGIKSASDATTQDGR